MKDLSDDDQDDDVDLQQNENTAMLDRLITFF
jgi:hypothetical protein